MRRALAVLAGLALATTASAQIPEPAPSAAPSTISEPPQAPVPTGEFDYRWSVPDGADLKKLIKKPVLIGMAVKEFKDPIAGENRLSGFGEAHVVLDVPLSTFCEVLEDYTGQPKYMPNLQGAYPEEVLPGYARVFQEVGIVFLGLRFTSMVRWEAWRKELPDGTVGYRSHMVESLDKSLFETFTSYYLKPVEIDGKSYLYVRVFSRPGLRKPFFGMAGIIKTFTPGALFDMLNAYYRECRKRLGMK